MRVYFIFSFGDFDIVVVIGGGGVAIWLLLYETFLFSCSFHFVVWKSLDFLVYV